MIAFMMEITTTPILSVVPFINFTLIFTDINKGTIILVSFEILKENYIAIKLNDIDFYVCF